MVKNYDYVATLLRFSATKSWSQKGASQNTQKRNWISLVSLFLMLFSFAFIQAQSTANYTFTTNATSSLALDANGNAIDMTSGTSQLLAAGVDDTVSSLTNLNLSSGSTFDFFFQSNRYNQFAVSDNGLLTLGATPGTSAYVIGGGTIPTIAAFANDMRVGTDGKVEAKIVGSGNNRTLVVQWTNVSIRYTSTASVGTATFQARLYESSGNIEFVYGAMATNASGPTVYNVGFSNATTANNVVSVNTTTNVASTAIPITTNAYLANATVVELHSTTNGSRRAYMFVPPGNSGNAILTTLAPPTALTFTGTAASSTTLNWAASAPSTGVLKYAIYRSSDGGSTYTYLTTTTAATTTYAATALSPSTAYFFKVFAISEGGKSTDLINSVTTSPAGNVSAIATGLWSATTTWSTGAVPTATDNVTIPTGFTVTEDVTAAAAYSLLVQGDLIYTVTTARTLTVFTNVTIDAGASVKSAATGTVVTHSLVVGGNLVNNGTIDFSTSANTAAATITFNTAGNANFTLGSGSVTNLKNAAGVTLNKGTNITNVLTFNPGGTLTVQGANALGFMVITNGLLKLDGTNTFSNPLFATAGYTIAANGGYWQNNPNTSVLPLTGSPTVAGLFRLSSGTFNIGTATGNSMGFSANSTINIEGGTVNAASRFGVGTAGSAITYSQTGGTINVNAIGNISTTLASFDLGTSATSTITFTAGTVNVILAGTGASGPRDVRGTAVFTPNYAGTGIVNFGTAASSVTPATYFVSGNLPGIAINTTSAIHNLSVAAANTQSFGNVTIPAGSTFNLNGFQFILRGSSVINNGTLTGTSVGSSLYFFAGAVPQSYSGAGVCTPGLISMSIDTAPNTFTLDAATSGINTLRVNLFSGNVINSNKITIGTGAAVAAAVQIGATGIAITAGNFDVSPVFNLGTGAYSVIYSNEGTPRTTGFEIPSTRSVTNMTLDNANGLVVASGTIEVTNALTLTTGIVTATAANYLIHGSATAAGTLTGGSATAYVSGPIVRTINDTNTSYVLFPVGKAGVYAPISLAPTTTSVSKFSAEAFTTNTGTANASIINLSATRRWAAPLVSGTFTDLNVRIGDANLIATNIPVQAPTAAGQYTSSFGSVATFAAATPNTVQSNFAAPSATYSGFVSYAISNACSGTPAPGATTATTATLCLGQSTTLGITTVPAGSGITYQWQSSTDGTTYADILGATAVTYVATPTVATFYRCNVTCSTGPASAFSTPVQITFTNSIVTTTPASRCGVGVTTLAATASAGATVNWYAAATGGGSLATGNSFVTPSIAATTTYYASANTATAGFGTIGTATTLTGATVQPTAFCNRWPNYWMQTIYTASELNAAGLTAGNITSLAYNIASLGDAATNANFTVKIGTTNSTSFANTTFLSTTAYTNVYGPATYTHTASGIQTITFTTPFVWDGVSNIVVNVTHDGADNINNAQTFFTATTDNKVLWANSFSGTTTTGNNSLNRLNITFEGQVACASPRVAVVATVSTPPAFTLSATTTTICSGVNSSAVTIATGASDYDTFVWSPTGVSGDSTTGWTFNPTTTTTYTLTASQSAGTLCSTTATVTVSVNPLPSPITFNPSATSTCVNTIVPLTAIGGATPAYSNSFEVLPTDFIIENTAGTGTVTANSTYYSEGAGSVLFNTVSTSANVNYQLNQNVNLVGVTSAVLEFSHIAAFEGPTTSYDYGYVEYSIDGGTTWVTFAPADYLGTAATAVFNTTTASARFSTKSYADWISTFTGSGSTPGTSSATTLWKTERFTVPASALTSNQFRFRFRYTTDGSTNYYGWLIDNVSLNTTQNNITWSPVTNLYTDAAATVPYTTGTGAATVYVQSATSGVTNYTATASSSFGCTTSAMQVVTINAAPTVVTVNPAAACSPATVNLTAAAVTAGSDAGLTFTYFTNAAATIALANPNAVSASGTYYVKGTNTNGCSAVASVVVTINAAPTVVTVNPAAACSPATVNLTAAAVTAGSDAGLTFTYFTDAAATIALANPNAVSASGTYYIKGTNTNGCSAVAAVTVVVNTTAAPTATSPQSFVAPATIANIVITATGTVTWYATLADANANTNPLLTSTLLVDNTTYYATQTTSSCPSAAAAVLVNVTLKNNAFNSAALSYYPNPTKDVITFEYSNAISNLRVINMLGQQVRTKNYNSTSAQLDLNGLASGTYIVEITSEGLFKQVKVVKAD